jgi:hypothetical protein
MKKITLIFIFFISLFGFSQNSKMQYGFQAGVTISNFRGYDIPDGLDAFYSEKPGIAYVLGAHLEFPLQNKLSLKIELNYERKTQNADNIITYRENPDSPEVTIDFKSKSQYDYIVLPILLKYTFSNKDSFYLNGGAFLGYLLKSQITNDLQGTPFDNSNLNTTSDNKSLDYGIVAGIGKNIELKNNKTLFIELRDNLGFANTSKFGVFGNGERKTNSINLLVGLRFN